MVNARCNADTRWVASRQRLQKYQHKQRKNATHKRALLHSHSNNKNISRLLSTNSLKPVTTTADTWSPFSLERTTCRPNADAPSATVAKDSYVPAIAEKHIAIATEANAPPALIPPATAPVPGLSS
ncbi:unnamed protein product [Ceratitis capitata]|uniref:(Mediterranean fruit fly) hypothetical protein n=1 Tax=Ceratitis capitata TaxID=7213 RepID=A0A811U2U7_CERCA|nr:unnamed protein product [Ceratitis capitata]